MMHVWSNIYRGNDNQITFKPLIIITILYTYIWECRKWNNPHGISRSNTKEELHVANDNAKLTNNHNQITIYGKKNLMPPFMLKWKV